MTEPIATPPQTTTPFNLRIHFEGAFVFSVQTNGNNTADDAAVTEVQVYAPTCDHLHAVSVNGGSGSNSSMYMLENYWHCIDPVQDPASVPPRIELGALKANLKTNTPLTSSNRPIGQGWTVAINLPGPQTWTCEGLVSTTDPTTGQRCFSGRQLSMIPDQVATLQVLTYTNVTAVDFHGTCFDLDLTPAPGQEYLDLCITSEMPNVLPTTPHQARAVASMASLLGLDLVFQHPLPPGVSVPGQLQPMTVHAGACAVGIVSMPGTTP